MTHFHSHILLAGVSLALSTAACQRATPPDASATESVTMVGQENLALARQETLQVGPGISGTLEAGRIATVRAEVGGAVLEVLAEPGQAVAAGTVLARIDDIGLRDGLLSAKAAVRSAEINTALATRNAERTRTLSEAGAIAEREREQAEWLLSTAETQLADARARLVGAEKQLGKTVLRAPFTGIVADRPMNAGDIVQPGMPLFTVVDPSSMKLEGTVTAEARAGLTVGTPVVLTLAGTGQLRGHISRIYPVVDPATRQIRVTVALPNTGGRLVSGLFAEGRVVTASRPTVVVPVEAVDRKGLRPFVVRVKGGVVERVEIELGLIDDALEEAEVTSGVAPGDTLLLGGARGLVPGSAVRVGALAETVPARKE